MQRLRIMLVVCLTFSSMLAAQTSPVIVFEHANVIDGVSAEPLRDVMVVVSDGKIESVGARQNSIPVSAEHFDLSNRWMLPRSD
jgi:cytosine/adenosine deaminase-related metal-dependent hydrolase